MRPSASAMLCPSEVFPDPGRPDEAEDAAVRVGVQGPDGEVLENAILDRREIVVVAVEDFARRLEIEPVGRDPLPRQRRDHLEIGPRHVVLGRLGRHLLEPPQLAVGDTARLGRQAGRVELRHQVLDVVVARLLAQLLADHPQLLAQHVLALVLVQLGPHLLLDLTADLEHLQLLREQLRQPLEPARDLAQRQQLHPRGEREIQVGRDEIGELAGVGDPLQHLVQLLGQVGRQVDDATELRHHVALQRLDARILDARRDERLVGGAQIRAVVLRLPQPHALDALDHHAHRAVHQLHHPHDQPERPDLVEILEAGMHHRPFLRILVVGVPHHPQQQPLLSLHHVVDQLQGARVADGERQHDVGIDDELAERQNGKALHVRSP